VAQAYPQMIGYPQSATSPTVRNFPKITTERLAAIVPISGDLELHGIRKTVKLQRTILQKHMPFT
jgi:polyisoprenoid-binding protein YceI